ncbi:glycosyltransferase family 2 protein [Microvirga alba]|uniref:Glycosyltransferase n=1 Tax=Microvirga alba TaxID=2791025 RepID=A0A931FPS6_9HYPH|nr:glycosyltransferase family 2 protein [Microvirga alba]MBF9235085.1 glycosyltransferase [Microvirga alba]
MHNSREPTLPTNQGLAEGGPPSTDSHSALPIEIGFLAGRGYSSDNLRDATVLAEFAGTPVNEFLLKYNLISETEFYRALAEELSVPFLSAPRLSTEARYPDSIRAGVAPLAGPAGGYVLAPRGLSLAPLLKSRRAPHGRLAITTPSLFTKAVFRVHARAIADHAANALPNSAPGLSSRDGVTVPQIASLATMTMLASFAGTLAPESVLAGIAAGMSLLFLGMVVVRLAASLLHNPVEPVTIPRRIDDAALPIYTIIVALYREKRVASHLIAALTRLDYPMTKLDIKLVLEADDDETATALTATELPGCIEVIVAPPGHPRTKPRALNVALPLARGVYTAVYDAEDVPDPGQLRLAVASFAALPRNVVCLQARLTIDNTDDSWLTRLFTIEYAALFDVLNPGLAEIGCPIPLGGTSNHFRTAALRDMGGWDAWNVTEDADLGIRLARLGYSVVDLPSSTLEEAPSTLGAWMNQRTRWMKGFMQTCISHSRAPVSTLSQLGVWRFYGALVVTLGTVLSSLFYPFFTCLYFLMGPGDVVGEAWGLAWLAGSRTLFVLGLGAIVVPACVALRRRRLLRLLPWVLVLPLYYGLVSVAAWRALWELTTAPVFWHKTSHGLARTSRTGRGQKHQAKAEMTMSLKTAPP